MGSSKKLQDMKRRVQTSASGGISTFYIRLPLLDGSSHGQSIVFFTIAKKVVLFAWLHRTLAKAACEKRMDLSDRQFAQQMLLEQPGPVFFEHTASFWA
jgi:hypothetical protein